MDDLLLAGTHQILKESLTELSRDLELKSSEVTTKPTRYLGRTQSSLRWERETDKKEICLHANRESTDLLENVD